jgi:hypothetical protein
MVMVVMVIVVMVVIVMRVPFSGGIALTGRRCGHSTPGLTVVPATILSITYLGPVVGEQHPELGGKWSVVGRPV